MEPASGDTQELFVPASDVDYMFIDLKPATEYTFKVSWLVSVVHLQKIAVEIIQSNEEHPSFFSTSAVVSY